MARIMQNMMHFIVLNDWSLVLPWRLSPKICIWRIICKTCKAEFPDLKYRCVCHKSVYKHNEGTKTGFSTRASKLLSQFNYHYKCGTFPLRSRHVYVDAPWVKHKWWQNRFSIFVRSYFPKKVGNCHFITSETYLNHLPALNSHDVLSKEHCLGYRVFFFRFFS